MQNVLVAGATGYLGGFVVKEFKNRGYRVRALARNPEKLAPVKAFIDEVHIGRATEPASLKAVCRPGDVVFSSLGITRQKDGLTYRQVDYQANLNLLQAARKKDVSKFIYISVLNAEKLIHLKMVAAKQAFVAALEKSGLPHAVIYPNGFFSDMVEIIDMARRGRGYMLGDGHYQGNPIHGADLAAVCADAVDSSQTRIRVGGPDIYTQKQLLELAFETLGKPPKITAIPLWARTILLFLLRRLTPVRTYGPLEFFLTVMAMDMIGSPVGDHHLKDFFARISGE